MSYTFFRTGSITIRPASSRTSTGSSSSSGIASITAAGILTAALFPHFFTTLFMIQFYFSSFIHTTTKVMCQQCRYRLPGRAARHPQKNVRSHLKKEILKRIGRDPHGSPLEKYRSCHIADYRVVFYLAEDIRSVAI